MRKKTKQIKNEFKLIKENIIIEKFTKKIFFISFFVFLALEVCVQIIVWKCTLNNDTNILNNINNILISIIAGYILYYITVYIPDKKHDKINKQFANHLKAKLSGNLKSLMSCILRDSKWLEKDDKTLRENFQETVNKYNIATDIYGFIYTTDENIRYIFPCRLNVISSELDRLFKNIQDIERYGMYFSEKYIMAINDLYNSPTLKELSFFRNVENMDMALFKKGNFLYETFEDMPIWIFEKICVSEIFINIVRRVISYMYQEDGSVDISKARSGDS